MMDTGLSGLRLRLGGGWVAKLMVKKGKLEKVVGGWLGEDYDDECWEAVGGWLAGWEKKKRRRRENINPSRASMTTPCPPPPPP
ncbi:hypothetical protein Drorol1_Dr00004715, partial [Drosera rotundifolia]